jgi:uncharacterized phage protein (TIGR01671 family)
MRKLPNRQIKFRIWFNKEKIWIHGPDKRASLDGVNLFGESILLGGFLDGVSIEDLNDVYALQFSGTSTPDKTEIFEGDILKLNPGKPYESNYEVVFQDGEFLLIDAKREGDKYGVFTKKLKMAIQTDNPIVIGNIFENPELLK